MKKIYLLFLIFCAFAGTQAQNTTYSANSVFADSINELSMQPLTLQQCVRLGMEKNYNIQIQQSNQHILDNNATVGNAGYLPRVDASGGYSGSLTNTTTKNDDDTKEVNKGVNNTQANAGLNMNWTVFDGFAIQTNYEKLKELQSMGLLNTRITIENVVADIAAEYFQLIRQKIRLGNLRSTVSLSKERLRIAEARYQLGVASRLDVQQARVDFNADSSRLMTQMETVYTSQIVLNQLMAYEPVYAPTRTADSIIVLTPIPDRDLLWSKTLSSNTQLLAAEKEVGLSEMDLKIAKSRNYPYVKLNAGYGYSANWYDDNAIKIRENMSLNYGATAGFTIFDGFNRKREQRNAKTQIKIRELQKGNLELGLKADMSNLWMAYQNNLQLLKLEKENVVIARDNYEIAMDRYKLGEIAGIELREAQLSLLDAEERESSAEFATKICEISLMQLSGDLLNYIFSGSI